VSWLCVWDGTFRDRVTNEDILLGNPEEDERFTSWIALVNHLTTKISFCLSGPVLDVLLVPETTLSRLYF